MKQISLRQIMPFLSADHGRSMANFIDRQPGWDVGGSNFLALFFLPPSTLPSVRPFLEEEILLREAFVDLGGAHHQILEGMNWLVRSADLAFDVQLVCPMTTKLQNER